MKKSIFLFIILSISFNSLSQSINKEKSYAKFKISNMGFNHVKGTIRGMNGDMKIDLNSLSNNQMDVSVDVSTINTNIKKRDEHLKTADFFEVEKYPTMNFKSSNIQKTISGYQVTGYLTIKDITKQVEIPFTVSENNSEIILSGNFMISRRDYNIAKKAGTFAVGNQIPVTIYCVLNK